MHGLRDGRDGSNVSTSSTGVVAREASGVMRQESALKNTNVQKKRSIAVGQHKSSIVTHTMLPSKDGSLRHWRSCPPVYHHSASTAQVIDWAGI